MLSHILTLTSAIYKNESKQLQSYYGEFFFTEMIEAADKSHKVLVADVEDTPVGAIGVTSRSGQIYSQKSAHFYAKIKKEVFKPGF